MSMWWSTFSNFAFSKVIFVFFPFTSFLTMIFLNSCIALLSSFVHVALSEDLGFFFYKGDHAISKSEVTQVFTSFLTSLFFRLSFRKIISRQAVKSSVEMESPCLSPFFSWNSLECLYCLVSEITCRYCKIPTYTGSTPCWMIASMTLAISSNCAFVADKSSWS